MCLVEMIREERSWSQIHRIHATILGSEGEEEQEDGREVEQGEGEEEEPAARRARAGGAQTPDGGCGETRQG